MHRVAIVSFFFSKMLAQLTPTSVDIISPYSTVAVQQSQAIVLRATLVAPPSRPLQSIQISSVSSSTGISYPNADCNAMIDIRTGSVYVRDVHGNWNPGGSYLAACQIRFAAVKPGLRGLGTYDVSVEIVPSLYASNASVFVLHATTDEGVVVSELPALGVQVTRSAPTKFTRSIDAAIPRPSTVSTIDAFKQCIETASSDPVCQLDQRDAPYDITQPLYIRRSNVIVRGTVNLSKIPPRSATRLRRADNSSGVGFILAVGDNNENVTIEDLTLDGNRDHNKGDTHFRLLPDGSVNPLFGSIDNYFYDDLIVYKARGVTIRNLDILSSPGVAMSVGPLDRGNQTPGDQASVFNVTIENVLIDKARETAFKITGFGSNELDDRHIGVDVRNYQEYCDAPGNQNSMPFFPDNIYIRAVTAQNSDKASLFIHGRNITVDRATFRSGKQNAWFFPDPPTGELKIDPGGAVLIEQCSDRISIFDSTLVNDLAQPIRVANNEIEGLNGPSLTPVTQGSGFEVYGKNITIENTVIENMPSEGIGLLSARNVLLRNNILRNNNTWYATYDSNPTNAPAPHSSCQGGGNLAEKGSCAVSGFPCTKNYCAWSDHGDSITSINHDNNLGAIVVANRAFNRKYAAPYQGRESSNITIDGGRIENTVPSNPVLNTNPNSTERQNNPTDWRQRYALITGLLEPGASSTINDLRLYSNVQLSSLWGSNDSGRWFNSPFAGGAASFKNANVSSPQPGLSVPDPNCQYVLSLISMVEAGATAYPLGLTTGSTCPWTASSYTTWASLNSSSGTGSATVYLSTAQLPNGSLPRTGSVQIGGQLSRFIQNSYNLPANLAFCDVPSSFAYGFGSTAALIIYNYIATGAGQCSCEISGTCSPPDGCQSGVLRYCPYDDITREQMAAFVVRSVLYTNQSAKTGYPRASWACDATPAAPGVPICFPGGTDPSGFTYSRTPYFADVPEHLSDGTWNVLFPYVQKLKELLTSSGLDLAIPCPGGSPTSYCPHVIVDRGTMAQWVIRAMQYKGRISDQYTYPTQAYFGDITASHPQFREIQKMREQGITAGALVVNDVTYYLSSNTVNRFQMGTFMIRALFTFP